MIMCSEVSGTRQISQRPVGCLPIR
uniref:Uncharacterized protein n=1 Tax=Anguilla anguilla TaxID=7936 RepID=A0A0E9XJM3_ANGAN